MPIHHETACVQPADPIYGRVIERLAYWHGALCNVEDYVDAARAKTFGSSPNPPASDTKGGPASDGFEAMFEVWSDMMTSRVQSLQDKTSHLNSRL